MQFIKIIIINGSGGLKPDDGKKEEKEKSYYSKKENLILRRMGAGNGKIQFFRKPVKPSRHLKATFPQMAKQPPKP